MFTYYATGMLINMISLPVCYEHFLVSPIYDWTLTSWETRSRHEAFHLILPRDCRPCCPSGTHFQTSISDQMVISTQWNDIEHKFSEHSDLNEQHLLCHCIQVDKPNTRATLKALRIEFIGSCILMHVFDTQTILLTSKVEMKSVYRIVCHALVDIVGGFDVTDIRLTWFQCIQVPYQS